MLADSQSVPRTTVRARHLEKEVSEGWHLALQYTRRGYKDAYHTYIYTFTRYALHIKVWNVPCSSRHFLP